MVTMAFNHLRSHPCRDERVFQDGRPYSERLLSLLWTAVLLTMASRRVQGKVFLPIRRPVGQTSSQMDSQINSGEFCRQ